MKKREIELQNVATQLAAIIVELSALKTLVKDGYQVKTGDVEEIIKAVKRVKDVDGSNIIWHVPADQRNEYPAPLSGFDKAFERYKQKAQAADPADLVDRYFIDGNPATREEFEQAIRNAGNGIKGMNVKTPNV